MSEFDGLFADLKVIDIATFIAAPAAATVLSDFGADVVKIEPLQGGDPWRSVPGRPGMPESPHNYAWLLEGRNRRSIALDLKRPEGQGVLARLVKEADILITNLTLDARARLGVDYDRLRTLNPRLIYASFTAFGETGAEAAKPGFDTTGWWARSGLMDRVRPSASSPPAFSVPGMGDHPSAMALACAIIAALYRRERTGEGAYVSSSLLANGAWANSVFIQAALCGARFPERRSRSEARSACHLYYRCRDNRWLLLALSAAQEETLWTRFTQCLGRPELAGDPRFADMTTRRENAPALVRIFDEIFATDSAAEWQRRLGDLGLSVALVAEIDDVPKDEQMRASGVLVPMPGAGGSEMTVTSPLWISGEAKAPPRRPPGLGEHTDEILLALGYSKSDIAALRTAKAIA